MTTVDEAERRPFRVSREGINLARRLEKEAQEVLITGLRDLAESAGNRDRMPNRGVFPGMSILAHVFAEWNFPRWAAREPGRVRTAQLVDAYRFENEMKYSCSDYAKYPPWARLDEIERHLGARKMTELFERGGEPFLDALHPGARVDVVAEQLRAEAEALDGKPAAAHASWLDE
jgi:hypothetical protein